MLDVLKVEMWGHRPPNLPEWRVLYLDRRRPRFRNVFAVDEMAALADTLRWLRWKQETFGRSDDQKT